MKEIIEKALAMIIIFLISFTVITLKIFGSKKDKEKENEKGVWVKK